MANAGVTEILEGRVLKINPTPGSGWIIETDGGHITLFNGDPTEVSPDHYMVGRRVHIYSINPITGWFATQPPFDGWYREWHFAPTEDEVRAIVQAQFDDA